ncbi:MAG TPA: phosphotransferase [Geobacteraceae bacterium]
MLIEMHCHTAEHSPCSGVAAVELVRQVFAKGLQGIVLTDHHHLWSAEELRTLRHRAGVPDHFLIMTGQELSSADFGDVLVYGAEEAFPRGTSLAQVRENCPAAALVWAHPYRGSRLPTDDRLCSPLLDGVEIFNTNHTVRGNSQGLRDWHRCRFTAIAGTDTHGGSYAGLYPTIFDHPIATIHDLATELRHGRCRPFFKEIPHAGANSLVTEVTIGTKGADENRERIIIRELHDHHAWTSAERAYRIMAAIAGHGFTDGPYRIPRPIDEDANAMTLIEQGVRGKSLYDKLLTATTADGRDYLQLTARWLARLHGLRLAVTPVDEFLAREEKRLARYLERFSDINHKHARKAAELMAFVRDAELHLPMAGFVQGHGDFHPKNVFVGQDSQDNRATVFVAAIDFASSYVMPPAFDVGCFLAQFRNQFFTDPAVLAAYPEQLFLDAYLAEAGTPAPDFLRQVELFRARTNLSIAAYLIKLGLGESEAVWRVLVEAEQALTLQ